MADELISSISVLSDLWMSSLKNCCSREPEIPASHEVLLRSEGGAPRFGLMYLQSNVGPRNASCLED
jgi:hypothetical protein